ncbi:MAG: OmpA family protein [Planctomycetaceae bacterium]|nr:OmpA family protein [Planctomycetaceae bacterium]
MSIFLRSRWAVWCLFGLLTAPLTGCMHNGFVPRTTLRQNQARGNQLWAQNKSMSQSMDQLQQQNEQLRGNLNVANDRIKNLNEERAQLAERFKNAGRSSPLTEDANARFEKAVRDFPGIEFDRNTGVAKLDSDLLFESGSDEIRPQAEAALRAVSSILNDGPTRQLRIQIVGHTDDRPIVKASTKAKHPTNWHLSTNRANSVLLALKKNKVDERRMRAAGAAMYESVTDSKDPKVKAKNRRVEIYILAPDAKDVAAWEQPRS